MLCKPVCLPGKLVIQIPRPHFRITALESQGQKLRIYTRQVPKVILRQVILRLLMEKYLGIPCFYYDLRYVPVGTWKVCLKSHMLCEAILISNHCLLK